MATQATPRPRKPRTRKVGRPLGSVSADPRKEWLRARVTVAEHARYTARAEPFGGQGEWLRRVIAERDAMVEAMAPLVAAFTRDGDMTEREMLVLKTFLEAMPVTPQDFGDDESKALKRLWRQG